MTNSELRQRLTDMIALLSVPGVGRMRFRRLVERFGSESAVLKAGKSELESVPDLGHATASAISTAHDREAARQIASSIVQQGWAVLFWDSDEYPRLLKDIPDRPPVLFRLGEPENEHGVAVAIVGTRHATESGRRFARKLAAEVVRAGLTVVSGMAEGIDAAAHRGALDAGGRTVAIWGTSLDIVYPDANKLLARDIQRTGAVYSEYVPGTKPDRTTFPERNRIISGMSEAVIVVEAGLRSGALITARMALEQGRELFAVPGPPDGDYCAGTNSLIKQGAHLLTKADDIFAQLPRLRGSVTVKGFRAREDLTEAEQRVVSLLADGPLQIDHLARSADFAVSEVMGFLLALEMKGVVQELSGKRFILAS